MSHKRQASEEDFPDYVDNDNDGNNDQDYSDGEYANSEGYRARHKAQKKANKMFATNLIEQAMDPDIGWDETEVGKLCALCVRQMGLTNSKIVSFFDNLSVCTPLMLTTMLDDLSRTNSEFFFETNSIYEIITSKCTNDEMYLSTIVNSVEQGLFDLSNIDTIYTLFSRFDLSESNNLLLRQFVVALCTVCDTKNNCGTILSVVTKDLEFQVAVGHIIEYITRDYFYDLEGSMEEFFNCIPQFCNTVQEILEEDGRLNSDGDLVASDEDENGNLKDFVASEDDDSDNDGEDNEEQWEDQDDDDSNSNDEDEDLDNEDDFENDAMGRKQMNPSIPANNYFVNEADEDNNSEDEEDNNSEDEEDDEEDGNNYNRRHKNVIESSSDEDN